MNRRISVASSKKSGIKKKKPDPQLITDHSLVSSRGVIIVSIALAGFLVLLIYSLYIWKTKNIPQPMEILLTVSFLILLTARAVTRYVYEMKDDSLRITRKGIFRTNTVVVAYDSIAGIYLYKPKLIGPVRFRRTVRMHTLVDDRDVWSIAYQVPKRNGKIENRRLYFKCCSGMLDALSVMMPGRVRVSENSVMVKIIQGE
jgi:hypothetical protein